MNIFKQCQKILPAFFISIETKQILLVEIFFDVLKIKLIHNKKLAYFVILHRGIFTIIFTACKQINNGQPDVSTLAVPSSKANDYARVETSDNLVFVCI